MIFQISKQVNVEIYSIMKAHGILPYFVGDPYASGAHAIDNSVLMT